MANLKLEPSVDLSELPTSPTIFHSEPAIGKEDSKTQSESGVSETRESAVLRAEEDQVNEDSFCWADISGLADSDLRDLDLGEDEKGDGSEEELAAHLIPLRWLLDEFGPSEHDIEDIDMATKGSVSWKKAGSLLARRRSSAGLSVTNLVSPLWCQYKVNYDLVGGPKRGANDRPKEFTVKRQEIVNNKPVVKKIVIKVDQKTAEEREKNTQRGKVIHEKLEKEVAPVVIQTTPTTREEKWGFKILALIKGFKQLIDSRLWRELPVFGIIDGIPVNGIIDQLQLRRAGWDDPGGAVGEVTNRLIISDIKTKRRQTSPQGLSASPEHKLQLMIYKKLLDDLISPEYDWNSLFKLHRLKSKAPFSDSFIEQQATISRANNFESLVADCTTLEDLISAWNSVIQEANIVKGRTDRVLRVEFRIPSRTARRNQESADSDSADESDLLAIKSFRYDSDFIKKGIATSLDFWLGSQPKEGVRVEETWKCNVCEYKENCEWRQMEASRLGAPVGTSKAQIEINMDKSIETR